MRLEPVGVGDNLTDKGRLFQTMGPETTKLFLQIWFLFLEKCSLGWWPNGDGVVLVHICYVFIHAHLMCDFNKSISMSSMSSRDN